MLVEFEYIRNGYRYPEKQLIVHKFTSIVQSSQFSEINEIYSLCIIFLNAQKDLDVLHIKTILEGLNAFDNGNYPAAKEKTSVVWQSLKKSILGQNLTYFCSTIFSISLI